jgi:hypothetical protein
LAKMATAEIVEVEKVVAAGDPRVEEEAGVGV